MKFETHNQREIDPSETSVVGEIVCNYETLVEVFGEPFDGDGHKVDAEWNILFQDGDDEVITTIYNWKDGLNYLGIGGTPKEQIIDWHIGGFDQKAVELVHKALSMDCPM